MIKHLRLLLFIGFVWGQYLTQKCQYDGKPLVKNLGERKKIEYGKWYTNYNCTGLKKHVYWISDDKTKSDSKDITESVGYGLGVLAGHGTVKLVEKASENVDSKKDNWNEEQTRWDSLTEDEKEKKMKSVEKIWFGIIGVFFISAFLSS